MLQPSYRVILGVLASILIAATGLWGLFAYGPARISFPSSSRVRSAGGWDIPLILAIGLAIGWVTRRHVMGRGELPGGIWTMLMAGVLGAWLGGTLVGNWGWVWKGVNLIGSLVIAFALTWGVGQGLAHLWGRGKAGDEPDHGCDR